MQKPAPTAAESDRLTLAYRHANVGIAILDPAGFYLEANPRYCEIIGRTLPELIGRRPSDFNHPDDQNRELLGIRDATSGAVPIYNAEKRYLLKDGSFTWVRVGGTVVRGEDGKPLYLVGSVEDINLQKRAELQLSEANQQLKWAESIARIGSFSRDMATGEVRWTESLYELLGLDPTSTTPGLEAYIRALHPDDRERVRQACVASVEARTNFLDEHRILLPSGEVRLVLLRVSVVPTPDRVVGVVQDITERRQAERLLDEQRMRLIASSKMSALGEMAGSMAHEINNPLAIILGTSMILRTAFADGKIDLETLENGLDTIDKTANRIARIVKGLRTFSRSAENDPPIMVPLKQVVTDTLELCLERFRAQSIRLELGEIPDARLECRPPQVSQVLLNLLSNAYDATASREDAWTRIDATVRDGRAAFTVSDNGVGIQAEVAARMMEPFFTTKDVNQGTGLGLSIAKGIAEDHGGELRYEPKDCTRFVLELPLRQNVTR